MSEAIKTCACGRLICRVIDAECPICAEDARNVLGVCCVRGCGGIATVDNEGGIFCRNCWEDLLTIAEEKRAWREKREAQELHALLRQQEIRETCRRIGRWIARWHWIHTLLVVVGALSYFGFAWGHAVSQWLQFGGN